MESLALGFEPCFSSLSPGCVTPEWVCTQVINLCFLPAFVEKTYPPSAETTALPLLLLLVPVISENLQEVFKWKVLQVALLFGRLWSSCFSEVVIFFFHIFLLLNLLLLCDPWLPWWAAGLAAGALPGLPPHLWRGSRSASAGQHLAPGWGNLICLLSCQWFRGDTLNLPQWLGLTPFSSFSKEWKSPVFNSKRNLPVFLEFGAQINNDFTLLFSIVLSTSCWPSDWAVLNWVTLQNVTVRLTVNTQLLSVWTKALSYRDPKVVVSV